MDDILHAAHIAAGRTYGREATCTTQDDYGSEERAVRAADAANRRSRRPVEAYPCAWCNGWHVGRAMSPAEMAVFMKAWRGA